MNESKNALLDELFAAFGSNDLLKLFNGRINKKLLDKCYNILNNYMFSSRLSKIPLIYESDVEIQKFLIQRNMKENEIPDLFFFWHTFCTI